MIKDKIVYEINGNGYELVKVTLVDEPSAIGYDIYKDGEDDPINLGDIAYFDTEPTKEDFINWLLNSMKNEKLKPETLHNSESQCPQCHAQINVEWEGWDDIEDNNVANSAICKDCGCNFTEVSQVVYLFTEINKND